MKLKVKVSYVFEREYDDAYVKMRKEDGDEMQDIIDDEEMFILREVIENIENRIDNIGYTDDWNRENLVFEWEDVK